MNLRDWYYKQLVTQGEMDQAFEWAQDADWNAVVDLAMWGVHEELVVQQAAVPDLTVDVSGPGWAHGKDGERIYVPTTQNVDCSSDEYGSPTAVLNPANEKYLSVFARFVRNPQVPEVDGNGLTVYTEQLESYQLFVRQGTEALIGTATPPPVMGDAILLADIHLVFGQTQILTATDIDTTRREDWVRFVGTAIGDRVYGTPQEAVEDLLAMLDAAIIGFPFTFTQTWFGPQAVTGPTPPVTTAQQALDAIVFDLAISSAIDGGAGRVGTQDYTTGGAFVTWAAASVQMALRVIADALDSHIGGAAPFHPATAITFTPYSWIGAADVQLAIQEIVDDLGGIGPLPAVSGASLVGFDNAVWTATGFPSGGVVNLQIALDQLVFVLMNQLAGISGSQYIGVEPIAGAPESWAGGFLFGLLSAVYGHLNARTERATDETVTGTWKFSKSGVVFLDWAREAQNVRFDNAPMIRSMRGGSNQPLGNRSILASGLAQGGEWASPFDQFNEINFGGGLAVQDVCVAFTAAGNRRLVIADDSGFGLLAIDPDRQTVFTPIPLAGLFPAGTWSIDSICSDGTYIYVKVTDVIGFTHRINAVDLSGVIKAGWPAQGTVLPGVGASPLGISHTDKVIVSQLDGLLNLAVELATVNSWQHCASGLSMSRINAATGAIIQNGDGDGPAIPVVTPSNCYPSGGLVCVGSYLFATFKDSTGTGGGVYSALTTNLAAGSALANIPYTVPVFLGQCIINDGTVLWCPERTGDIWCYQQRDQVWNVKQGAAALGDIRFAAFDGLNIWVQELESPNQIVRLLQIPAYQYFGFAGQQIAAMVKTAAGVTLDSEAAGITANQMGRMCFDGDSVWVIMNNTGSTTGSGIIRRIPLAGLR